MQAGHARVTAASAAVARKMTSRVIRPRSRARFCMATTAAASIPLSSIAPRPYRYPPRTSPANGSTLQCSRSTPTTSMWPMTTTGRLLPFPLMRATSAARPAVGSNRCVSIPAALRVLSR